MSGPRTDRDRGLLVAEALRGAWRADPPSLTLSEDDLAAIAPRLAFWGEAPLVWRRIESGPLARSESAALFREAWLIQAVRNEAQERTISEIFVCAEQLGARPVLSKGWRAAQAYADSSLRAVGDIDLYMTSSGFAELRFALTERGLMKDVDLHEEMRDLDDFPGDGWMTSSERWTLRGAQVWVLNAEMNLRHLCWHFVRHGAWRALALCDIAAALEAIGPSFRTEIFRGGDPVRARWCWIAVLLARDLLGADNRGITRSKTDGRVPSWVRDNVLSKWGRTGDEVRRWGTEGSIQRFPTFAQMVRSPGLVAPGLRGRWTDALSVSAAWGVPPLPYPPTYLQAAWFVRRYLTSIPSSLRTHAV